MSSRTASKRNSDSMPDDAKESLREEQKKSAPDNSIASMDKEVESMMSSLDWNDRNKPTSLDD